MHEARIGDLRRIQNQRGDVRQILDILQSIVRDTCIAQAENFQRLDLTQLCQTVAVNSGNGKIQFLQLRQSDQMNQTIVSDLRPAKRQCFQIDQITQIGESGIRNASSSEIELSQIQGAVPPKSGDLESIASVRAADLQLFDLDFRASDSI